MAAIKSKNKKLVELLINNVSDIDIKNSDLNSIFHLA